MEELFVVNAAGQLEVNWDSLALVTSVEFVSFIKRSIDSSNGRELVVEIRENEFAFVVLTMYGSTTLTEFYFSKSSGFDFMHDVRRISSDDVASFIKYGGVFHVE